MFVRYTNEKGKRLRGLYILKSETDKALMKVMGNLFTHYNYTTTDISITSTDGVKTINSLNSNFEFSIEENKEELDLPEDSPFDEWKQARRFAGPLPFTFTYNKEEKSVLIIEGVRSNWKPTPIHVLDYKFEFLDSFRFNEIILANAFEITNIPYYWKKGKLELWN